VSRKFYSKYSNVSKSNCERCAWVARLRNCE